MIVYRVYQDYEKVFERQNFLNFGGSLFKLVDVFRTYSAVRSKCYRIYCRRISGRKFSKG